MALARIAVLASGRGSNLAALLAAERAGGIDGAVVHVVANRPDAAALEVARAAGVATTLVDHARYAARDGFDAALADALERTEADLVVLAGFMRVLGNRVVDRWAGRMLNIHPSLLPAYPGLRTHRRALADGARIHGCTVHYVARDVDVGPIVAQAALAVNDDDDEISLAARVLELEHRLLPAAVGWHCAGHLVIEGARVRVNGSVARGEAWSPATPDAAGPSVRIA